MPAYNHGGGGSVLRPRRPTVRHAVFADWLKRLRAGLSSILLVYGMAAIALVLVSISLIGDLVGSITPGFDFGSFTIVNYLAVFTDPQLLPVLERTFLQGLGTIVVMSVFGVPIAWLIARTDIPGKNFIITLLTAQLAIPGFITAMAYAWLLNPTSGIANRAIVATGFVSDPVIDIYQIGWICVLQGIAFIPGCVFMILPAMQSMDLSLEEAAWANGVSTHHTVMRVIVPLLAPTILSAMFFFFVIGIELFDFIAFIGIPGHVEVISLWIYDAIHSTASLPNYGYAAATGTIMLVLTSIALFFYMRCLRQSERYAVVTGKARRVSPLPLGRWRPFALTLVAVWLFLAIVLPILTLIWTSIVPFLQMPSLAAVSTLTLNNYALALSYIPIPLTYTLSLIGITVGLTLLLSVSGSWVVTRGDDRFGRLINLVVFLSPAVPTMVAAVAFQMAAIAFHKWIPLYGSITLVAIAMATRMIAFASRTINSAAFQLHKELDEAAYASGLSRFETFREIFLPNVAPALWYSALMVAMLTARELTLPLMIVTGHSFVLSTLIFDLQTNGETGPAAALSLVLVIALGTVVFGARNAIGRVR